MPNPENACPITRTYKSHRCLPCYYDESETVTSCRWGLLDYALWNSLLPRFSGNKPSDVFYTENPSVDGKTPHYHKMPSLAVAYRQILSWVDWWSRVSKLFICSETSRHHTILADRFAPEVRTGRITRDTFPHGKFLRHVHKAGRGGKRVGKCVMFLPVVSGKLQKRLFHGRASHQKSAGEMIRWEGTKLAFRKYFLRTCVRIWYKLLP